MLDVVLVVVNIIGWITFNLSQRTSNTNIGYWVDSAEYDYNPNEELN
jgi:hypothetical protein